MSMNQPFRPARPAERTPPGTSVVGPEDYDYAPLGPDVAGRVRTAAQRIRQTMRRTLANLIAVGTDLLSVKEALPHGEFGDWLGAEFGWTERTARNFMAVAERFGAERAILTDLYIEPTAAYLLAAPSSPREACEAAVRRAEGGERVTASVAREILRSLRRRRRAPQPVPPPQGSPQPVPPPQGSAPTLHGELLEALESFRRRWDPRAVAQLARQLHEFADSLEEE